MKFFASIFSAHSTAVVALVAVGSLTIGASAALAQVEQVGNPHRDWTVYTFRDGGSQACFILAAPPEKTPPNRGDISMRVTHRPGAGTYDEVSFTAGYPFAENSNVTTTIGSTNFVMFTSGETAWTTSPDEDQRMVRAMKAGAVAVVKGRSQRGTNTTDRISLSGFTAAYNAMSRICRR